MSSKPAATNERYHTVEDLVRPFGWAVEVPELTDTEKRKLYHFLRDTADVGLGDPGATLEIPKEFWLCVNIPRRVLPTFTIIDAQALAAASIQTFGDLLRWKQAVEAADLCELISYFLNDCVDGRSTPAGDVYTDMKSRAIWFGRKAGKAPAFSDDRTYAAFDLLFGLTESAPSPLPEPAKPKAAKVVTRSTVKDAATAPKASAKPPKSSERNTTAAKPIQQTVSIFDIASDPENDRKTFDKAELQELAQSIMRHGVLQPLLLRPDPDRVGYGWLIVAGERRWRAAKLAGLTELPAQICELGGLQVSLARLDENLKRVDLSPIEKAQAIRRLMDSHKLSQREVGESIGVQQGQISNMLRLLNLPESLQQRVSKSELAPTLVRPLLPFADVPAVAEHVDGLIEFALKNEDEISASTFESWVDAAVDKCSRSMSICPDYRKPTKADRCFGAISKELMNALDLREVNGKPRAFNVPEFNRLNKEPLANKLAAYKRKTAVSSGSAKAGKQTEKPLKDFAEHRVKSAIASALISGLVTAIQKDSPESNRVLLTLAIHCCFSDLVPWSENKALKIFEKVPGDTRQALAMLRAAAAKSLKGSRLTAAEIVGLGNSLRVDLAASWKASKEVVDQMTMTGLKQVARAIDVDESLFVAEAKLRAAVLKAWPAGYVPPFLASMIGKKDSAKKQKAA